MNIILTIKAILNYLYNHLIDLINVKKIVFEDGSEQITASKSGASLFDIKVLSQAIADKGWAFMCHTNKRVLAKADVPTVYNNIKDKYDNAEENFVSAEDTTVGKVLYDNTDGRTYWFTWDSLNYSESMDMSNPQTLTLSEVSYYNYVLLGNNINLVFDYAEYMKTTVRVYNKSWEYIKSFNVDGRYFTKYQKTDNGLVAVAYYDDGYGKLLQVLRVEDDIQADYSITDNIFDTYGLMPLHIANKIYDNKIYITGRTKQNIGLGAIFTLEIDINDFTSMHLYQSDDLGGGYTWAISNLAKYDNVWYIVYETYVYSSTNLINWTQRHNLSQFSSCIYDYNNSNYYFVLSDRIITTTDFVTYNTVTTYSANSSDLYFFFADTSTFFLSYVSNGIVYGGIVKTIYTDTYSINGNSVAINYYKKDGFKICIADGGTNDTNLETVLNYLGYLNYWLLDINNETITIQRNKQPFTLMYIGDDFIDDLDDLPTISTRPLPQAEVIDISSASVSLDILAGKNYVLSNTNITDITFNSCQQSSIETTIEFITGVNPPTLTDNSGLIWNGGVPTLIANMNYTMVIFNNKVFYEAR